MPGMRPILQPLQPTHAVSPHAQQALRVRSIFVAALVLAMAVSAVLATAPALAPAATLATKRAQAAVLDREVRAIEGRYDELQERYRGAQWELVQIRADVAEAHAVVVATRKDLGIATGRLADRASAIYRTGGAASDLAELATAASFADFFDRADMLRRVGDQDASVLDRVEALNATVEEKEHTLTTARERAAKAAKRARADKQRMGAILDMRQAKLGSVNAEIRTIMDAQRRAEAARAAAEARVTAARVMPAGAAGPTTGAAASSGTPSSGAPSSGGSGGGSSIPLPPGSGTAAAAANAAMGKLGSPYLWAASGPDRFDCSGLVTWAFAQAGRPGLPHSTYALITMGVDVPLDQLQVGDLLFSASVGHMGIYVGNGSFVHSPRSGDVVKVTSLSSYSIATARRI